MLRQRRKFWHIPANEPWRAYRILMHYGNAQAGIPCTGVLSVTVCDIRKSGNLSTMNLMPNPARLRTVAGFALALLVTGCASYAMHQHMRVLAQATQDDAACEAQGWRYPEPRYVTCRMQLQDARLHKDWMNLQLMHQTQAQPTGIPQAYPYKEVYRPLDRDHFSCQMSHEGGQDYVLCDEDSNGPGTPD